MWPSYHLGRNQRLGCDAKETEKEMNLMEWIVAILSGLVCAGFCFYRGAIYGSRQVISVLLFGKSDDPIKNNKIRGFRREFKELLEAKED